MSDHITNFQTAGKKLFEAFKCKEDVFVSVKTDYCWTLSEIDGINVVNYYKETKARNSSVVVKTGGKPAVFGYAGYTMIIAVECVKVALIFKNELKDN